MIHTWNKSPTCKWFNMAWLVIIVGCPALMICPVFVTSVCCEVRRICVGLGSIWAWVVSVGDFDWLTRWLLTGTVWLDRTPGVKKKSCYDSNYIFWCINSHNICHLYLKWHLDKCLSLHGTLSMTVNLEISLLFKFHYYSVFFHLDVRKISVKSKTHLSVF